MYISNRYGYTHTHTRIYIMLCYVMLGEELGGLAASLVASCARVRIRLGRNILHLNISTLKLNYKSAIW